MVLKTPPSFGLIWLGSLVALVCGGMAAVGTLAGTASEHARKAEVSATGSQLKIAVTAPVRPPVPAPAGKLATMPDHLVDAGAVARPPTVTQPPAIGSRERASANRAEEVVVTDGDEDVVAAPRYARAWTQRRSARQANDEDAYDQPPLADPPGRYRLYREEDGPNDWRPEPRRFDDRYAAGPSLGERYYPPYGR